MGKIKINRSSEWTNKLRKINLYIDDVKIDCIEDGELKTYEVEDGNHSIQAKIDWCGSNKLNIDVDADGVQINLKANNKVSSLFQIVGFLTFTSLLLTHLKENGLIGIDLEYFAIAIIPLFAIVFYHIFIGRNKFLKLQER